MPWRVSYELQVEGLIEGSPDGVKACVAEFTSQFPQGGPSTKASWSGPFVLGGYQHCGWTSNGIAEGSRTALLFHAEVKQIFPIDQGPAASDLDWFYHYKTQQWYRDLTAAMQQVETVARSNKVNVVRPLGVRAWRWYCGNGGP